MRIGNYVCEQSHIRKHNEFLYSKDSRRVKVCFGIMRTDWWRDKDIRGWWFCLGPICIFIGKKYEGNYDG